MRQIRCSPRAFMCPRAAVDMPAARPVAALSEPEAVFTSVAAPQSFASRGPAEFAPAEVRNCSCMAHVSESPLWAH